MSNLLTNGFSRIAKAVVGFGLIACLSGCQQDVQQRDDFSRSVTQKEWAASLAYSMIDRAAATDRFHQAVRGDVDDLSTNEKTLLGIAYIEGYQVDKNITKGRALLKLACDEGQVRACRSFILPHLEGQDKGRFDKAMTVLEEGCEQGYQLMCGDLVYSYAKGQGVAQDEAKAEAYVSKTCVVEDGWACGNAAAVLAGVSLDKSKALLDQYCGVDNMVACYFLGAQYSNGRHGAVQKSKALPYFEKTCARGMPDGCQGIVNLMHAGSAVPENPTEIVDIVGRYCDQGVVGACETMSAFLYGGDVENIAPDYERAFKYSYAGCEHNSGSACQTLALQYQTGKGIEKDLEMSHELYLMLCEYGYSGQYTCQQAAFVSLMIETGETPDRNSLEFAQAACDYTVSEGCRLLAWGYLTGNKVEKDQAYALSLFEMACEDDNAASCLDLGSLNHYAVHGIAEDLPAAIEWYDRACKLRDEMACQQLQYALDGRTG